ncbi:hypothetical protein AVEN_170315-1 [Araneus ventricosus]|uniref:Uncharacterized protein n=1 Tax=Araneus ventricosus TaxID=182803 RepID=A0A4Y2CAN4_ARAVE|nr:hypothetical protein AVEN_170315-1 [Araneus ventricosus]
MQKRVSEKSKFFIENNIFAIFCCLLPSIRAAGRGGLVVRCRPRSRRVPGSKLDYMEDPSFMGPARRQILRRGANVLLLVWCESLERWVPTQEPSSSCDLD